MIKGIHHISMKCEGEEEFARVKEFYLDILGLSVCREWPKRSNPPRGAAYRSSG